MDKVVVILALAVDEAVRTLAVIHLKDALALIEDDMTIHKGAVYILEPENEEMIERWVEVKL